MVRGKATEDSPTAWAVAHTQETWKKLLAPGFGLFQPWPLWPFEGESLPLSCKSTFQIIKKGNLKKKKKISAFWAWTGQPKAKEGTS